MHAILVCRAVGEMREAKLAELVILELPDLFQIGTGGEADRPT